MKLPLARIEEFLGATGECELKEVAQGYSIDSRTVQPSDLFFAVKGERLDGHDFVHQALERGAVSAVVRKDQLARFSVKTCLLAVDDTLVALQTLATAVRRELHAVDGNVPAANVKTMDQFLAAVVAPRRFNLELMVVFAAAALLLAASRASSITSASMSSMCPPISRAVAARSRPIVGAAAAASDSAPVPPDPSPGKSTYGIR